MSQFTQHYSPLSPRSKENRAPGLVAHGPALLVSPERAIRPLGEHKPGNRSPVPSGTKTYSSICATEWLASSVKSNEQRLQGRASPRKESSDTLHVSEDVDGIFVGSARQLVRKNLEVSGKKKTKKNGARTAEQHEGNAISTNTKGMQWDAETPLLESSSSPEFLKKTRRAPANTGNQGYRSGLVMAPDGVTMVKDRRKCKPRGVLTVELRDISRLDCNPTVHESTQMPRPAVASVKWNSFEDESSDHESATSWAQIESSSSNVRLSYSTRESRSVTTSLKGQPNSNTIMDDTENLVGLVKSPSVWNMLDLPAVKSCLAIGANDPQDNCKMIRMNTHMMLDKFSRSPPGIWLSSDSGSKFGGGDHWRRNDPDTPDQPIFGSPSHVSENRVVCRRIVPEFEETKWPTSCLSPFSIHTDVEALRCNEETAGCSSDFQVIYPDHVEIPPDQDTRTLPDIGCLHYSWNTPPRPSVDDTIDSEDEECNGASFSPLLGRHMSAGDFPIPLNRSELWDSLESDIVLGVCRSYMSEEGFSQTSQRTEKQEGSATFRKDENEEIQPVFGRCFHTSGAGFSRTQQQIQIPEENAAFRRDESEVIQPSWDTNRNMSGTLTLDQPLQHPTICSDPEVRRCLDRGIDAVGAGKESDDGKLCNRTLEVSESQTECAFKNVWNGASEERPVVLSEFLHEIESCLSARVQTAEALFELTASKLRKKTRGSKKSHKKFRTATHVDQSSELSCAADCSRNIRYDGSTESSVMSSPSVTIDNSHIYDGEREITNDAMDITLGARECSPKESTKQVHAGPDIVDNDEELNSPAVSKQRQPPTTGRSLVMSSQTSDSTLFANSSVLAVKIGLLLVGVVMVGYIYNQRRHCRHIAQVLIPT